MLMTVATGLVLGIILGSFVKATADRLMTEESLGRRSHCTHCKQVLAWYDLLPFVSYLLLSGKCRRCHKKIPLDVFLTEVVLGILTAGIFLINIAPDLNNLSLLLILMVVFQLFILVIISIIFIVDLKTGLIPDKITYPASVFAGAYLLFLSVLNPAMLKFFIWALASGIGLAGLFFLLIVITSGKGMGFGDVKYVFFLGLALGFPNSAIAIMLGFLIGAVFALILIAFRKKHFGQTIPFGPFLSLGAGITLFWGSEILNWYIKFMG